MARILAIWDMGTHSGFGTVAAQIGDRLVTEYGHDIHTLAINYKGDYWPTSQKLYPASQLVPNDTQGLSRYVEILGKVMPEVILMLNDPSVVVNALLNNQWDPQHVFWGGMQAKGGAIYRPPIIAYMPIDGENSPGLWDILKQRVTRVAMSSFGQAQMPEAPLVWHGVDPKVYYPVPKKDAKRALGYDPDRFLILRVDKNSFRKHYPSTYLALRPLLRRYTDIDVHFHCLPRARDGYDLNALRFNDEDVRDRINFSANIDTYVGWSEDAMRMLYSAADLFVTTSMSEGFGLTILEAMACGTPVVAQNCTSITEVVGPGGVLIKPKEMTPCPTGQWYGVPDIDRFTAEIEHLYQAGGVRRKLAKAGVEHAAQFSWDVAARKFDFIIRKALEDSDAVPVIGGPAVSNSVEVPT